MEMKNTRVNLLKSWNVTQKSWIFSDSKNWKKGKIFRSEKVR